MWDVLITTADKRTYRCPAINTGPGLLAIFGMPSITLGQAIPLRNGATHRSFRFIGPDTQHVDLTEYQDVFSSRRQWLASIRPIEE